MIKEYIKSIIRKMTNLENGNTILVDMEMVQEPGQIRDIDNFNYRIELHKVTIKPLNNDYEKTIEFSISTNPYYHNNVRGLAEKIEKLLNGYDLRNFCKIENLDHLDENDEEGLKVDDTGAICFLYEVKTKYS